MPAVVGFHFFLKTEQDNKQVEPISLGVGYFTGLLWVFLFALWCWEAQELKYCSRETPKSCGGEMNLQPDEFTGPAAGSEAAKQPSRGLLRTACYCHLRPRRPACAAARTSVNIS